MVLNELGKQINSAFRRLQDESLINEDVFKALLNDISRALLAADVNLKLVVELKKRIVAGVNLEEVPAGVSRRKKIEETVVTELRNLLDPGKPAWKPSKKNGAFNIIMFVGLQGAGKTTTCTKLAYYYKQKKFKVGLICADTFRAGANDQLKMNATKVDVPFYGDAHCSDPVQIAMDGLEIFKEQGMDLVIVDTSGRHKQEAVLFEEMTAIHDAVEPDDTIFVMDSSIGQNAYDQAKAFHDAVDVGSVILTKLDGHARGGGALSAVAATGSPITFIGTGEKFHEIEPFNAERFVKRILGRGDLQGLAEKIQEADVKDGQEELLKKLQTGSLTLRDMKAQFINVLKLGPVGSIMQMIPGFNNLGKEHGDESQNRLQRYIHVMDSMNEDELDGDIKFLNNDRRVRRICQGAGVHPRVLDELRNMYRPFEQAAKNMKNLKMGKNGMPQNPNDLLNMFPPQVQKQLGGASGIRNLMKKFEGGNFDPEQMQKMMQGMGMGGMGMGGKKIKTRTRRR